MVATVGPTGTAVPSVRTLTVPDWRGGPDWAWARALGAANGVNPFFDGWIGPCDRLRPYAQNVEPLNQKCFFTDRTGQRVEFTYDGARTYHLYYDEGDTNRRDTYNRITGSLLFPLRFCPVIDHSNVVVTVWLLTANGLENFCGREGR